MEIEWIEDFLSLAEARNFSRAARLRHSSQPAFSRRIQALEGWLGVELIDRSSSPPRLTPAGRAFRGFAENTVRQLYQARALLQGRNRAAERPLHFAVAYTLALTFFPDWFADLLNELGGISTRVSEMNVMSGAAALVAGEVDFLICYHHPQIPVLHDLDRYPHVVLGRESFRPYSACSVDDGPAYRLPGSAAAPLPFLAYAPGTFFVHLVDMILLNAGQQHALNRCYQSQMSEAIKAMVVAGNGVGWLPGKCVEREVADRRLAPAGDATWGTDLEIRMFGAADNRQPEVVRLWDLLHCQTDRSPVA